MIPDQRVIEAAVACVIALIGLILIVRAFVMPASFRENEARREELRKKKLEMEEMAAGIDAEETGEEKAGKE